jgi:hypothetical protein
MKWLLATLLTAFITCACYGTPPKKKPGKPPANPPPTRPNMAMQYLDEQQRLHFLYLLARQQALYDTTLPPGYRSGVPDRWWLVRGPGTPVQYLRAQQWLYYRYTLTRQLALYDATLPPVSRYYYTYRPFYPSYYWYTGY